MSILAHAAGHRSPRAAPVPVDGLLSVGQLFERATAARQKEQAARPKPGDVQLSVDDLAVGPIDHFDETHSLVVASCEQRELSGMPAVGADSQVSDLYDDRRQAGESRDSCPVEFHAQALRPQALLSSQSPSRTTSVALPRVLVQAPAVPPNGRRQPNSASAMSRLVVGEGGGGTSEGLTHRRLHQIAGQLPRHCAPAIGHAFPAPGAFWVRPSVGSISAGHDRGSDQRLRQGLHGPLLSGRNMRPRLASVSRTFQPEIRRAS